MQRSSAFYLSFLAVLIAGSTLTPADDPSRREIGAMVLEGIPAIDPDMRARILQYLQVRGAELQGIADDGRTILISTRFGDTAQLHRVAQPGGAREQLTFFDEPVGSGLFIPETGAGQVIFGKDQGGDEKTQYILMNLEDGRYRMLTDGQSRHASLAISHSGQRIAFTGNARNGRDFDVYTLRPQSGKEPTCLLEFEGMHALGEFSPDDSKLLVLNYLSERETQWFVVDADSGQNAGITPLSPPAYYGGGVWAPDGNSVYLTSDREGEFRKLYRLDLNYDKWTCLTTDIPWDVEDVAVEPKSGGLAFTVNEDGMSRLYFADGAGNARRRIDGLPTGLIGGLRFSKTGAVLAVSVDSYRSPSDVYTVSYPDGRVTRWTQSEIGGLNAASFVEPELIHFPTFDSVDGQPRMIPAFYYRGRGDGPRPVVIYAHGGPESQFRPGFISTFQSWAVELGISVIAPNIRGSTGYGRAFHQLDNGVRREDSIKDIGGLLDWIARQPGLDAQRVGVFGGSYGGYVVLASLATYPERFKAGIDVVGIANFSSFLENTSDYRRDLRRAEYGDERDSEVRAVLERISPLNNAEKIQAALFVLHGKNDPRVPVSEAELIVAKSRELGRPVWYALANDEGHGFRKKPNRDLASVLYASFWLEHLLK